MPDFSSLERTPSDNAKTMTLTMGPLLEIENCIVRRHLCRKNVKK
jgi:hypothetical protein